MNVIITIPFHKVLPVDLNTGGANPEYDAQLGGLYQAAVLAGATISMVDGVSTIIVAERNASLVSLNAVLLTVAGGGEVRDKPFFVRTSNPDQPVPVFLPNATFVSDGVEVRRTLRSWCEAHKVGLHQVGKNFYFEASDGQNYFPGSLLAKLHVAGFELVQPHEFVAAREAELPPAIEP